MAVRIIAPSKDTSAASHLAWIRACRVRGCGGKYYFHLPDIQPGTHWFVRKCMLDFVTHTNLVEGLSTCNAMRLLSRLFPLEGGTYTYASALPVVGGQMRALPTGQRRGSRVQPAESAVTRLQYPQTSLPHCFRARSCLFPESRASSGLCPRCNRTGRRERQHCEPAVTSAGSLLCHFLQRSKGNARYTRDL